jgi:hypothetical protein
VRAILSDNNVQGHVAVLYTVFHSEEWHEFWDTLNLPHLTLAGLELDPRTSDADIWQLCQREQYILITGNRNDDGPDSLEATLRTQNRPDCLPVFTIADMRQLLNSRDYAIRVALKLLDYLLDIDKVRGTGRLYLP